MKLISMLLMSVMLTACGVSRNRSGIAPSVPAGISPSCKSIYSVWHSTVDFEVQDFSQLQGGVVLPEYEYTANDGALCGYVYNPNHYLSAQIKVVSGLYDYQVSLYYDLPMGGQCATYTPVSSIGNRYANELIKMDVCNQIEICDAYGICKTFR